MKQKLLLLALALGLTLSASAKPYSVTVLGEYGYNITWEHYGGGEVRANLPLNDYFELDLAVEGLSSRVYTGSFTARPKFPLSTGELFLDGTILYKSVQRNRINDYVTAASFGYRMDYVSVQLGIFTRIFGDMDADFHSLSTYSVDPFNVLYRIQVNTRPEKCPWNIYFGVSDYTELEYERHYQPLFWMGAHYDLPFYNVFSRSDNLRGNIRNLRVLAEVYCKPTGMFHLDAQFYGIQAKLGLCMRF